MLSIQIDQDVFAFLQQNAVPFVDTPNVTLRRLLGLDDGGDGQATTRPPGTGQPPAAVVEPAPVRRKQAKASLPFLVASGDLRDGETLHLIDYHGARVPGSEAVISGNRLVWKGQAYSMSDLACRLLKKLGHKSDYVRGPRHWANQKGDSVLTLWERHLASAEDAEDVAAVDARRDEPTVSFEEFTRHLREQGLL